MLILSIEKLAEMGISIENSSKIAIQDKNFQMGPTFSLKMRSAAIGFCEQEESQGSECLLVENATALTVWRQISPSKHKMSTTSESDRQEFVKRCHQELKKSIGPMATLIIDELVNGSEPLTRSQLIDRIVAQIPDPKLVAEFRAKIQP